MAKFLGLLPTSFKISGDPPSGVDFTEHLEMVKSGDLMRTMLLIMSRDYFLRSTTFQLTGKSTTKCRDNNGYFLVLHILNTTFVD